MFRGEKTIEYESTLERDFLIRKEFLIGVLDITPQPCVIPYRDAVSGVRRTYTPDFFVMYRLGDNHWEDYPRPELVEVKPRDEWRKHWRRWLPKWKAARRWVQQYGGVFRVYDETRIRDRVLENIAFLNRYKCSAFAAERSALILGSLEEIGMTTVDSLVASCFTSQNRTEGLSHLWHLMATRKVDADLTRPLNLDTEIWIPEF